MLSETDGKLAPGMARCCIVGVHFRNLRKRNSGGVPVRLGGRSGRDGEGAADAAAPPAAPTLKVVVAASDLPAGARLGALAAAEVIGHIGARPQASLQDLARQQGLFAGDRLQR